jgi:hypothetical protein
MTEWFHLKDQLQFIAGRSLEFHIEKQPETEPSENIVS